MGLTYEEAHRAIAAAHTVAVSLGVLVAVAVVDSGGHLIALGRMDGARPLSPKIAQAKAVGAALFHRDGDALAQIALERPAFFYAVNQLLETPLVPSAGSALVERNGVFVGAIGVSGGQSDQDLECALAGLRSLAD